MFHHALKNGPLRYAYAAGALIVLAASPQTATFAAEPREAVAAVAPVTALPPAPTVPASLTFEQEVAGRRALFAARDACRTAQVLRFAATWQIATRNGGADKKIATYNGTESLALDARGRRLNLVTETTTDGGKTVRRAISNGDALLTTRFEQKRGGKTPPPPTRDFLRLPFGPDDSLATTLYQAQMAWTTRAADWAFDPEGTFTGQTWRDAKGVTARGGVAAHAFYEIETTNNDREKRTRARRYVLADKTSLPVSFEQWTIVQTAARREGDDGSRVTYRREDYATFQAGRAGAVSLPASLWAQATPAGYVEKPLPNMPLPNAARGPKTGDPQALALLARWTRAHDRMLSYTAEVSLTVQQTAKTPDAPPLPADWRDQNIAYTVWLQRPGKARLTLNAINPAAARQAAAAGQQQQGRGRRNNQGRYNQSLLAVADGTTVSALDRTAKQGRSVSLNDPAQLGQQLLRAGWDDWAGTLNWLLVGPRALYQNAETVTYGGKTEVDGEPVEVVSITSLNENNRRRRDAGGVQTTTTIIAYLGADGLPRATETYRTTDIEGSYDRDEPPNLSLVSRYRNARADAPPPSGVFTLTAQDAALIRPRGR